MKNPLNPDFTVTWPPRYVEPAPEAPVIGKPRPAHLHLQVAMTFFASPPLTVQVHAPTQRGAYTAALVHVRRRHTQKRCTELTIAFIDLPPAEPALVSRAS